MTRLTNCGEEDTACVQRILKSVVSVQRRMKHRARRCNISLPKVVKTKGIATATDKLILVHASLWRHAITCSGMQAKFKRWLNYQNALRKRLHLESCKCNAFDLGCLQMNFHRIKHVQRRVVEARREFTDRIATCDRCQHLKLRFRAWLVRQRANRQRLHDEICRCRVTNTGCVERRVARIKQIQAAIVARRAAVMSAHRDCTIGTTTTTVAPTTTAAPVTAPPIRTASASILSVSGVLMVALIAALLF